MRGHLYSFLFCFLIGLHSKLDHLTGSPESINVSAVLLSAVYPHGGTAGGYDVTDYQDISPEFGIMDDFYNLRVAMHKKGMSLSERLILSVNCSFDFQARHELHDSMI